jgi:adenosylcobinamide-GDP ribazoletransferase
MPSYLRAVLFAVQFLTRIPLPPAGEPEPGTCRTALIAFPLSGWLTGFILIGCWLVLPLKAAPSTLCMAALLICIETVLNRQLHLGGLITTADAFLGPPVTAEHTLAVMEETRIGVMGAVALVLGLLMKLLLLSELLNCGQIGAIVVYPALGRWTQVLLFSATPYVRPGGIVRDFAREADIRAVLAASALMIPALLLSGFFTGLVFALVAVYLLRRSARARIGGITAEIAGAACVLSETAFLLGVLLAA